MKNNANSKKKQFLNLEQQFEYRLKYLTELRNEIECRINTHTQFVMQKIVTIVGGIALLYGSKSFSSCCCCNGEANSEDILRTLALIIFPIVAFIYDIMISKNINNIHKLGCFIKHKIEDQLGEMWEHYAGQKNKNSRCYGPLNVTLLIIFDAALLITCISITFVNIKDINNCNELFHIFFSLIYTTYTLCLVFLGIKVYKLICTFYDEEGEPIFE